MYEQQEVNDTSHPELSFLGNNEFASGGLPPVQFTSHTVCRDEVTSSMIHLTQCDKRSTAGSEEFTQFTRRPAMLLKKHA